MDVLQTISIIFLILSVVCAIVIVIDIARGHRQKMAIMDWVWPITAIWSGPIGLWAYFTFGRMKKSGGQGSQEKPSWQVTTVGTLHCAAGCTVGDFAGEWLIFLTGFTI